MTRPVLMRAAVMLRRFLFALLTVAALVLPLACGEDDDEEECEWVCAGGADYCSQMYNSYLCGKQQGCSWNDMGNYCSGNATSCGLISDDDCSDQEGCYLDEECS